MSIDKKRTAAGLAPVTVLCDEHFCFWLLHSLDHDLQAAADLSMLFCFFGVSKV